MVKNGQPGHQYWPDRLRLGVARALGRLDDQNAGLTSEMDVHHVVAVRLPWAFPARLVLARWSISVSDGVNAAILPRRFHQAEGLHRRVFVDEINRRLIGAERVAGAAIQTTGAVAARLIIIQTMQKLGNDLVLRSGDLVAMRLQGLLRSQLQSGDLHGGDAAHLKPLSRYSGNGSSGLVRDSTYR